MFSKTCEAEKSAYSEIERAAQRTRCWVHPSLRANSVSETKKHRARTCNRLSTGGRRDPGTESTMNSSNRYRSPSR